MHSALQKHCEVTLRLLSEVVINLSLIYILLQLATSRRFTRKRTCDTSSAAELRHASSSHEILLVCVCLPKTLLHSSLVNLAVFNMLYLLKCAFNSINSCFSQLLKK